MSVGAGKVGSLWVVLVAMTAVTVTGTCQSQGPPVSDRSGACSVFLRWTCVWTRTMADSTAASVPLAPTESATQATDSMWVEKPIHSKTLLKSMSRRGLVVPSLMEES